MAMDISEIRHKNFIALLKEFQKIRGGPERGLLKNFGEQVKTSDRQLSHMKCKNRAIGKNSARKIEQGLGLEIGWMDSIRKTSEIPNIKIKIASANNVAPIIKEPRGNQRNVVITANKRELLFIEAALKLYRKAPLKAHEYLLQLI
jgi:hypothetical protein